MQKTLLVIALFFLGCCVKAQTFSGNVGSIPGIGVLPTCFTATVSGVGNINTTSNGLASICLDINHPSTDELQIVLTAPDGTVVPLTVQNGGGANYTGTCFTATASSSVKFGSAPFTGSFLPEGYLGTVNNGQNADGTWALCILDSKNLANAGTLVSWALTFSNTPAPQAPVLPACTFTLPASSSCATATAICDTSGFCGSTSIVSVQDWAGSGLNSCFNLENNNFIKFEATASSASFTVWITGNTLGLGGGLQMLFFDGTCGSGAVSTYGCYPHIYPYKDLSSAPLPTNVIANGLTPGNTYYLMIDGYNGDNCSFKMQARSGIGNTININPAGPVICAGKTVTLIATGGSGSYNWSPAGGLNTTSNDTVTASPLITTLYTVSSNNSVGCTLSKDVTVTVNDIPVITSHPDAAVQNICKNDPVPALSVTATAGSGTISNYQWYITTTASNTTGAAIPFANLSTYTPSSSSTGTLYFYCKVTNSSGCTVTSNLSGAIIISSKPATPLASATIQPSCLVPSGTIVATFPSGINIEYSVGGTYQSSGTFTGLAPGNYSVTARNILTGCVSAATSVTINAIPVVPATPVGAVTAQPTCSAPGATIDISSPAGPNIQYSVGGAYQSSGIFTGLTAGTMYIVTAKDLSSGCVSSTLVLLVDPLPTPPSTPVASLTTKPDCFTATGTITISSPIGANIEYNINAGAYQDSTVFSGLTAGATYSVVARDNSNGCVSTPVNFTVSGFPTIAAPMVNSPVLYCQYSTPSPLTATGTNLLWYNSSTGGPGSATAPLPSTALAGTTTYYVSQTTGSCESPRAAISVIIIAEPVAPGVNTPVAYCENAPTALLSATGTSLLWYTVSTGGTGTATAPLPLSATAGNTVYYVSQTVSGCESPRAAVTVTINPIPAAPAITTPVIYCQNTIAPALTAAGSNLLWYTDATGGSGTSTAPVPPTVLPGDSIYYVSQTVNGCESPRAGITVTVNPTPAAPLVTTPIFYCQNTVAASLNATGGSLLWYTAATGGAGVSTAPIPSTTTAGNKNYYATQTLLGCESPRTSVTVTVYATPATPAVTSPVTYCQYNTALPLTATGSNLLWYNAGSGGSGSVSAPTPGTNTPGNTFYYVSQTINGCEGPRSAITVTINPDSTAVTSFQYNPDTVCINGIDPGPAYALGFTTGGNFSSTPGLSVNPVNGSIKLSTSTPGSYLVKYDYPTTGCIKGGSTTTRLTLNPAVSTVTVFSYSSPVCKNDVNPLPSMVPGFTIGGTFISSPGLVVKPSTGEVDLAASRPGNYQITYNLTALGCRLPTSNFSYINIIDTTRPVTHFSYTPATVCITSSSNPSLAKAAGFTSGGTFTATPAGLNINAATGAINIGLSTPGVYKIKYTVPKYLCRLADSDSTIFTITPYASPVTGFDYYSPVCQGDSTATPVPVNGFTPGGIFSSSAGLVIDAGTGVVDLTKSTPGTYSVTYTVAAGDCNPFGIAAASINILKQPVPPSVTPYGMCGPGDAILNATSLGTIKWYTEPALINQVNVGNTMYTHLDKTTVYYLTSTVGTCASEGAPLNAQVFPLPRNPFLGNDTAVCSTDKFILKPGVYDNYLWQDGSTQSTFTVTGAGNYKVTVSNADGCSDSSSINVAILDNCDDVVFPSAFSPDGNGLNDKFGPLGNLFIVSNYQMRVFNRYGAVVFSSSSPYQKWDGTEKGKPGNGNYVYVATYTYKNRITKTQKGSILIVR